MAIVKYDIALRGSVFAWGKLFIGLMIKIEYGYIVWKSFKVKCQLCNMNMICCIHLL